MANEQIKCHTAGNAQHGHQFLGAFLNKAPVAADDAARHIMGAHHQFAFQAMGQQHLGFAIKGHAPRIAPILLKHIKAGAVLLILNDDQRLIEHGKLVILVDEHVFIAQAHITFTLKQGVLGITSNHVGAVNQFFISFAPYENPEIAVTVNIPNGYSSANAAYAANHVYKFYYGFTSLSEIEASGALDASNERVNGD